MHAFLLPGRMVRVGLSSYLLVAYMEVLTLMELHSQGCQGCVGNMELAATGAAYCSCILRDAGMVFPRQVMRHYQYVPWSPHSGCT